MSVAEALERHRGLERQIRYNGLGMGPVRYRSHPEESEPGRIELVADGEGQGAKVLSYSFNMNTAASGLDALRSELTDRWGEPTEPEGLQRLLIVSMWRDPSCDIEAQLLSISSVEDRTRPPDLVVMISSLEARARFERRKEKERERRALEMER
jgi:hypothetical protein